MFSFGEHNFASGRAVGTDPSFNQTVTCGWDGVSSMHVQVMDQNDIDTETLGERFIDLRTLQLDTDIPMPVEISLEHCVGGKGVLQCEITLRQS